jgi:hypothetical protein
VGAYYLSHPSSPSPPAIEETIKEAPVEQYIIRTLDDVAVYKKEANDFLIDGMSRGLDEHTFFKQFSELQKRYPLAQETPSGVAIRYHQINNHIHTMITITTTHK